MTVAAGAAKAAEAELLDYNEVVAHFQPVLGLEVHVELSTATKMFCGCATTFGAEPNTQVCPVCLGLPGSLPVLNRAAVESAIRIGLALNCEIVPWCRFARKNYFYPDMPKNYQISQYDEPIAINGYLDAPLDDGTTWRVEIERAHMEEDTGKLTHVGSETGRIHGATGSLIDYNRAGVPLIEIVTKPIEGAGARAPQIARAYVTALRDLLRALDVSDVRMDQGSMRCDANVSLKPAGATEFGTRTETKNVNSLKSVEVAVRYEMQRQGAILASGGRITQETRHFHEAGYTSAGRTKETAEDYRYFPEPDLEPVAPSRELVERLRQTIPELPWLSRRRIQQEWGVSDEVMRDLVNAGAVELVAATVEHGASSEAARAWWGNFLAQKANEAGIGLDELAITPAQVAAVVALVDEGKLSNSLARQVVEGVLAGEGEPEQVMTARGLALVRDDSLTQAAVDEALAANPDVAEKIRGGKVAAAGAIVGAVMKATRGQADAARVRELVLEACGQG
ncbi:Asp-tRNA(Asn)/Glu-tRNA(Gln) amidotransferase subunit GatB [Mycobacterium canetti]|uniref:Asp-tRNA(Asn)/Glu-tRNA(Gln) amidotransferase subunit GatB n=1 Tax=Mycobacterium canetti TaxID=78331 RepID=UPI0002A56721|nr:Asp-tRNA(Asn)/Glu-tRNA(Gln) amidotransferase subunit GatB [Mycobacterium canetti]CCK61117.1 Putative glutamyl-tRNA(Gln) amidotransferase (subunit B) GatB (Glu-ADT subunit B) [Mycobacterium canettii CIPT 140070010]